MQWGPQKKREGVTLGLHEIPGRKWTRKGSKLEGDNPQRNPSKLASSEGSENTGGQRLGLFW